MTFRQCAHALSIAVPSRSRLALVVAISLGYAMEVLFQPDVFTSFSWNAIVKEVSSIFVEGALVGLAILLALGYVQSHAARRSWLYSLQLVAAAAIGSTVGVVVWAALEGQDMSAESVPFLAGEIVRLASLGAFLAVTHGLAQRVRAHRVREQQAALEDASLRAETELAQLRLLEAQIEPHFLFNTIANVRRTWHVDPSLGMRMHDNAVRYLSASLPRMRGPLSTLRDEMDLTRAYLELFSLRMGSRLRFSIDLPPALAEQPFPRMSVLTLVENSIKHGIAPSENGGAIVVRVEAGADSIVASVEDDGVGFGGADTGGTGMGLANIRARLLAQYGRRGRLDIESSASGGVVASIRVPREGAVAT